MLSNKSRLVFSEVVDPVDVEAVSSASLAGMRRSTGASGMCTGMGCRMGRVWLVLERRRRAAGVKLSRSGIGVWLGLARDALLRAVIRAESLDACTCKPAQRT